MKSPGCAGRSRGGDREALRERGFSGCRGDGRSILGVSNARLVSRTRPHRDVLTDPRGAGGGGRLERTGRGTGRGPARVNLVKGVPMKRIAVMVCAVLGLALSSGTSQASWG